MGYVGWWLQKGAQVDVGCQYIALQAFGGVQRNMWAREEERRRVREVGGEVVVTRESAALLSLSL